VSAWELCGRRAGPFGSIIDSFLDPWQVRYPVVWREEGSGRKEDMLVVGTGKPPPGFFCCDESHALATKAAKFQDS
jgi:hypothetical protein